MQKMIRILAIIAVILVAFSMLALLISIPLQRVLAAKVFNYPEDMVAYLPIVPFPQLLRCLLLLGCAILVMVCAGKKGVILPEIILLIVLLFVIPGVNNFLPTLINTWLGQTRGSAYVAANSVANTVSNFCTSPAALGNSLALVVCGMNMVYKKMSKQLDKLSA